MFGAEDARNAEVHDLHGAGVGHHQVCGLEIAMDDAGAMCVRQRVEDLHAQVCRLRRRERTDPIGQIVERLSAHELHHHQQLVVLPVQFVQRRDAGMVQPRERDGFRAKALEHIALAQLRVEDLDRHFAVECLVDRLVDGPHPAPPEAIENTIFTDSLADHRVGYCGGEP